MMKLQDIKNAVRSKFDEAQNTRAKLVEYWSPLINPIAEAIQAETTRELTVFDKQNMAVCLENAVWETAGRTGFRLFEATQETDISWLGIQLPIIGALLPSLVLNRIAQVQAMDRRQAAVFYLDIKHGTAKGSVAADDTMISAKTGVSRTVGGRRYAIDKVFDEDLSVTSGAVSATGTLGGSVIWGKGIKLGTLVLKVDDTEVANDAADPGTIAAVSGGTYTIAGTVTSAGVYALTISPGLDSASSLTADYQYTYDQVTDANGNRTGVAEVNVSLSSETLTAQDFTLKALYSLGASMDLLKAHGLNLESELIKYLGGEIKFEVDHWGIDMIVNAATGGRIWGESGSYSPATTITSWDASVGSGQHWAFKKFEFIKRILEGSNNIYNKTFRGFGNFIIAGNNVAALIRQLDGHFTPASDLGKVVPTGPIELGSLDGSLVIQDPLVTEDRYVVGYRGDNYLFAGMIYAPYLPLFATPTVLLADLFAQKGFMSSAGFKIINAGLYTYGDITNY